MYPGRPSYMRPKAPCHGGCWPRALAGGGPGGGGIATPEGPGAVGYRGSGGGGGRFIILPIWPAFGAPMGGGGGGGTWNGRVGSAPETCLWPAGYMMDGAGGNPPRGTKWAELLSTVDGGEVCCRRREFGVCAGDGETATAVALVVEDLGRKLEADGTGWRK